MNVAVKFFVFCLIGGISLLIDLSFVNLFFFLNIPFPVARTLSISIALLFNFFANRTLTFNATHKPITKQVIPYVFIYLFSNGINLLTSILIVTFFGETILNINIASLLGTAISVPISFLGSLLIVFKK